MPAAQAFTLAISFTSGIISILMLVVSESLHG